MKFDLLNIFGKDPGPDPLPRNRVLAFHICWTALVPAFCYMYLADAPLFFLLAIPFSLISVLLPKSVRLNSRTKIYSFVGPLVVASLIDLGYKVNMDAYFMTITVISPLLIFYAISISFLDQRPLAVVTGLAAGLGAMLLQGMTTSPPEMARMAGFVPHGMLTDRFQLFILGILAQSYSVLQLPKHALLLRLDRRGEAIDLQLKRAAITIVATLTLFGTAAAVSIGGAKAYTAIDGITNPIYLDYMRAHNKRILFRSKIRTDATLEWKMKQEGKRPALFITSDLPPGYLRGRTYQSYTKGEWLSADVTGTLPTKEGKGGLSALTWMKEGETVPSAIQTDVIPADRFVPEVIYVPGNVSGVQAICDRVRTNDDGILTLDGWDKSSGYRYFCQKTEQMVANQSPEIPDDRYLVVSEPAASVVFMYARKLTAHCKTDAERIMAIRDYLQTEFEYSLKATDNKGEDPVVYFLRNSHAGHCELFASATVLMLRSLGIKSRYVTGFVCMEPQVGNTYVARLRDAHAWVEAWVPETGWTVVESTPASGIPQGGDNPLLSRYTHALSAWFKQLLAGVKRGYFAKAVISGIVWLWHTISLLLLSPWGVVIWPILILAGYAAIRRLRRVQIATGFSPHSQEFSQLRQRLIRFLKVRNITYSNDMSLRDILREANIQALPRLTEFSALMLEYERLRYSRDIEKHDLDAFSSKLQTWLREHG